MTFDIPLEKTGNNPDVLSLVRGFHVRTSDDSVHKFCYSEAHARELLLLDLVNLGGAILGTITEERGFQSVAAIALHGLETVNPETPLFSKTFRALKRDAKWELEEVEL